MPHKDPERRRAANREANRRYRAQMSDEQREARNAYQRRWRIENREHLNEAKRRWRLDNPEKHRAAQRKYRLKTEYGLTVEEADTLLAAGCAICGASENLHIDHCHETGKAREALCNNHNTALGMVGDDPGTLRSLADYVERHAA